MDYPHDYPFDYWAPLWQGHLMIDGKTVAGAYMHGKRIQLAVGNIRILPDTAETEHA